MIDALRGKNINQDDQQNQNINMQIVEMDSSSGIDDIIPTFYDPINLERYFNKRPTAIFKRIWQVLSTSASYMIGLLSDYITGNVDDIDVRRAAELRNTIVSLGPFFIKLGKFYI